ncbi:MAG: cation diffusion facilitator family transporter [Oscillospiraceae bacterium]
MTKLLIKTFIKNSEAVHDIKVRGAYGRLAGVVGIICNLALCISKLVIGFASGSIAISADAVNNLSDASSNVISLVGFKLSSKPADKEHPFGHARIEYVSGLTVAVLIMLIGVELAKSGVQKIISPSEVEFSAAVAVVLSLSIGVKLWMAMFNKTIGRIINSTTLEATAADSRNDVITTFAVLLASIVQKISGVNLDGYMGVAVAIFILCSGVGIVRDT